MQLGNSVFLLMHSGLSFLNFGRTSGQAVMWQVRDLRC